MILSRGWLLTCADEVNEGLSCNDEVRKQL